MKTVTCLLTTVMLVSLAAADVLPVRAGLKVEDLGSPVQRRELGGARIYRHPRTNGLHLFVCLNAGNGLEEPDDAEFQILDLDLSTGTFRSCMGPKGFAGRMWFHSNGKLYIAVGRPSLLVEYDPLTAHARIVGAPVDNYYAGSQCFDEGPNGLLYIGTYQRYVAVYDPKTDKMRRFGPVGGAGNEWVYQIAGDSQRVYAWIQGHGHQETHVIDLKTGATTPHTDIKSSPFRATDGKVYSGSWRNPAFVWQDGKPVKLTNRRQVKPQGMPRELWYLNAADKELGLVVDTDDMNPNTWNGGAVTVRWRSRTPAETAYLEKLAADRAAARKAGNLDEFDKREAAARPTFEMNWRTASFKGVHIVPNAVRLLADLGDGTLLGYGAHYGPLFIFDPQTRKSEYFGMAPGSLYQILVTKPYIYFSGYSSVFAVYDRGKPYRFFKENSASWIEGNPWRIGAAKWCNYIVQAADGRIYAAGNYGRHTTGSELTVWDPADGKRERAENIRTPLLHYRFHSLCTADGGKLVVLSLFGSAQKDGEPHAALLIYDTTTRGTRWRRAPAGTKFPKDIFASGPNTVTGVSDVELPAAKAPAKADKGDDEDGDNAKTNGLVIARVDLATGKLLSTRTLAGRPFAGPLKWDYNPAERRLAIGPDGCGWLFVDNTLCRVRPDGDLQRVLEMKHGAALLWVGDDLYLFNGGRQFYRGFCNILRIRSVFQR